MAKYLTPGRKKPVSASIFEAFGRQVSSGEYQIYTAASLCPSGIPWGGEDCDCVVVAGSMSGGSPIYVWQMYRAACDYPPRHKLDVCLYAPDGSGGYYKQHSKPVGYHHNYAVSLSGLSGLMHDNHLPSALSGTVDDFRTGSAYLKFG